MIARTTTAERGHAETGEDEDHRVGNVGRVRDEQADDEREREDVEDSRQFGRERHCLRTRRRLENNYLLSRPASVPTAWSSPALFV